MEGVIAVAGLVGGWLLLAGPVYQAALELREQDLEHERLRAMQSRVAPEPPLSAWWWLLPPVRVVLLRRRSNRLHRAYVELLDQQDVEALFSFMNKATGWMYVSAGALLIALKETWEAREHFELGVTWFWVVVAILLAACVGNTVVRLSRSNSIVLEAAGRRAP